MEPRNQGRKAKPEAEHLLADPDGLPEERSGIDREPSRPFISAPSVRPGKQQGIRPSPSADYELFDAAGARARNESYTSTTLHADASARASSKTSSSNSRSADDADSADYGRRHKRPTLAATSVAPIKRRTGFELTDDECKRLKSTGKFEGRSYSREIVSIAASTHIQPNAIRQGVQNLYFPVLLSKTQKKQIFELLIRGKSTAIAGFMKDQEGGRTSMFQDALIAYATKRGKEVAAEVKKALGRT